MSEGIAREQLKSIVARVERLSEEAKAINDDKAEVYKEAKANGFNTKVIKRIVARRNKDAAEADEEDAIYDLYMAAINGKSETGTINATRAGTREPKPNRSISAAPKSAEKPTAKPAEDVVPEPASKGVTGVAYPGDDDPLGPDLPAYIVRHPAASMERG